MGNENSTIGLSEEDSAELQRATEKHARRIKEIEDREQRKKKQAEDARQQEFIDRQLAERARLEAERKEKAERDSAAKQAAKAQREAKASEAKATEEGGVAGRAKARANSTGRKEKEEEKAKLKKKFQAIKEEKNRLQAVSEEKERQERQTSASLPETTRPNGTDSALSGWESRKESQQNSTDLFPERRKSPSGKSNESKPGASRTPTPTKEPSPEPKPTDKDKKSIGAVASASTTKSMDSSSKPTTSVKRGPPSGGFDFSTLSKIPKRNSETSPRSPREDYSHRNERLDDVGQVNDGQRQPPQWYSALKPSNSRHTDHSGADVLLQRIKGGIGKIKKTKDASGQQDVFGEVRTVLHKLFFTEVTAQLLRDKRMLHNNDGLPQIFDQNYSEGVLWPYDVKADAEELYNKWCSRTFEIDLLRGIVVGRPKTAKDAGSSDSIDPNFPKVPANYYGNGRLLNGQWWPTQLTALRDGAHGVSQGGIWGQPGRGAYSIIISGGDSRTGEKYPDVDEGDTVQYCGTDNNTGEKKPSDSTQRLIESYRLEPKRPVRVLRSMKADPAYAPEFGFRYDGLYDVVDVERMDEEDSIRQRYRFMLKRREGQDPIRGGSGPERRPTEEEVEAYKKDKTLRGYGAQQQWC